MRYVIKSLIFAVGLFLVVPSISAASYVIKLKNGRKISVEYYWEEGDKILFNIYGGTVEIRKDLVKEIEDLPDEKEETPKTTQETEEGEMVVEQGSGEGKYDEPGEEPIKEGIQKKDFYYDEEFYKNKKISLILELKDALERYKKGKEDGQNETMASEYRRASRISAELENLKKEVIEKNSGILPDWWSQDSSTNP